LVNFDRSIYIINNDIFDVFQYYLQIDGFGNHWDEFMIRMQA